MATKKIVILCGILLLCTAFLFSQNRQEETLAGTTREGGSFRFERTPEGMRIIQRLSWIRGAQDFRYEALIQQRDERGSYKEIQRESTEDNFIEMSLPRGRYRYRVAVYNLLDQVEYTTAWVSFGILPAVQPWISHISPKEFALKEDTSFSIEVRGENFLAESDAVLVPRGGGEEIRPSGYTASSTGESARLDFELEDLRPGDYDLYFRNAGNFEDRVDFAIHDFRSSDFFIGLAYSPFILLHGYPDAFFDDLLYPMGFSLHADYFFHRMEEGRLGASIRLIGGRMVSSEKDNGMRASLWIAGALANALYEYKLTRDMVLHMRAGGGAAALNVSYDFSKGTAPGSHSTWMPALNAGISWEWLLHRHAYVEAGLDYLFLFSKDVSRPGFLLPFVGVGWRQ